MMRRGFGIVYALVILVLIATIAIYSLELSGSNAKSTSDEHVRMQLQLYMNSSVEYALLWMSADPARSQNPSDMNLSYDTLYRFSLHIEPVTAYLPAESNGTVMLDVLGLFDDGVHEPLQVAKRLAVKP